MYDCVKTNINLFFFISFVCISVTSTVVVHKRNGTPRTVCPQVSYIFNKLLSYAHVSNGNMKPLRLSEISQTLAASFFFICIGRPLMQTCNRSKLGFFFRCFLYSYDPFPSELKRAHTSDIIMTYTSEDYMYCLKASHDRFSERVLPYQKSGEINYLHIHVALLCGDSFT